MADTTNPPSQQGKRTPGPDPRSVARSDTNAPPPGQGATPGQGTSTNTGDTGQDTDGTQDLSSTVLVSGDGNIEVITNADAIRNNLTERPTTPIVEDMITNLRSGITVHGAQENLVKFGERFGQVGMVRCNLDPNRQPVARPKHADDLLVPAMRKTAEAKRNHAIYMANAPLDPQLVDQKANRLEYLRRLGKPYRLLLKAIDAETSNLENDLYQMATEVYGPLESAIPTNSVLADNLDLLKELLTGDAGNAAVRRKENLQLVDQTRNALLKEIADKQEKKPAETPGTTVTVTPATPSDQTSSPAPATPAAPKGQKGSKKK